MDRGALWKSGRDEAVEVNQRALIDKILARYSGEHTIFRELLQNADDAGAQHVQIKFYTERGAARLDVGGEASEAPKLPDLKKDKIHRYVVTNDGIPFRPQDWNRLKKIAEGNPDESLVGAFGVGFYSLFSATDDPFVESGSKWMGFYWKDGKDQLMARSGDLPPREAAPTMSGNALTSFTMSLRDPSVLEGPLDLARFFVTSLSFTRTIRKIDMLVDDIAVLEVDKKLEPKQRVTKAGLKGTSTAGMMRVTGVDKTGMVITAKVVRWLAASGFVPPPLPLPIPDIVKPTKAFASFITSSFFGRSTPAPEPAPPPPPPPPTEDETEITTLHREIQVYQAEVGVTVSPAYARELERATKKAPPKVMPVSMVYSRPEAVAIVDAGSADVGGVFSGLCPPLGQRAARVFIGQATGQTTGVGGHLAARFIPTVERESIDLVDKHVSHWNRELLWISGHLCRLIYELELQRLQGEWAKTSVADTAERARVSGEALHALRYFTFDPTTPSAVVGQEMESAFYQTSSDNRTLPIVSTAGVLPIKDVRMPSAELAKFIPDLPVVPQSVLDETRIVARLRERGLLRDVAFDDVVRELGKRPLSETEMVAALSWWQSVGTVDGYGTHVRARLLDAAILVTDSAKIVPLSTIQTFVKSGSAISPDMPLPSHTLPFTITKDLRPGTAYTIFGWTELTLVQYVQFLVQLSEPENDIRTSAIFAERVLNMLGRAWQSVSANHQTAIALELKDVACIPTKAGFKRPSEAYFEKNLLFDDLPTIALPKTPTIKGGLEKMLLAIGVRKTVDLQLVFSRLVGGGTWTCQDLMKYLVSVKDTLSAEEVARLRQTAAFPLEVEGKVVRRKPRELYEPTQAMRELGLPLLDWGEGKWRPASDEAKMIFSLGLRRFPPIDVLLGLASQPEKADKALQYLLANMGTHYTDFDPRSFAVAYVPATKPDGSRFLAKPGEVFTNWSCSILGFAVADPAIITPENAAKLRIPADPPMEALVAAFSANISTDVDKARKIFEYLSTQGQSASLDRLRAPFIPVGQNEKVKLYRPSEVYFAAREDSLYKSAFTFIDFGERANMFLRYCGVKSEPSVKDIAGLLMREPERMLRQAGSPERYLEQLRLLAANWAYFDASTRNAMKSARFLLASQRVQRKEDFEREWVLSVPSETAVIDDITLVQYFGAHVLGAPEEQLLETFYEHLGARRLSSMVKVEYIPHGPLPGNSAQSVAMRKHVLERLTIFLAEARRAKAEYSVETLAKEGNFVVHETRNLEARYVYRNGRHVYPHIETLYAMAQRKGRGIVLTVSVTAQPDDYDVASALCSALLKNPKADDALLLYSILSTPLMALKKRGFNVDRILNQQREERMRLKGEQGRDRERQEREASEAAAIADAKAQSAIAWPNEKGRGSAADDAQSVRSVQSASTSSTATAAGKTKSLIERFRGRKSSGSEGGLPQMPGGFGGLGSFGNFGSLGRTPESGPGDAAGGVSTTRPTDVSSIRNTVQRAVDASRPETATQIADSRMGARDVSESQADYCDTSAKADLEVSREVVRGMKVWVPRGCDEAFLADKMGVCARFAEVLERLGGVYNLGSAVINVFWDLEGPLIAFNRGGAIFCNARYFAAWHDRDVQAGKVNDAYISWYFSIAHELAHNLETAHNSAHEFYFSSIAEEYLVRFTALLRG